jgi:hypothetical protein
MDSGLRSVEVSPTSALDQRAHHAAHVLAAARLGELRDLDEILGTATAPFSWRTISIRRRRSSAVSLRPGAGFTKASGVRPFCACGAPTTMTLPTGESGLSCLSRRIAPSISSVPSGGPRR